MSSKNNPKRVGEMAAPGRSICTVMAPDCARAYLGDGSGALINTHTNVIEASRTAGRICGFFILNLRCGASCLLAELPRKVARVNNSRHTCCRIFTDRACALFRAHSPAL